MPKGLEMPELEEKGTVSLYSRTDLIKTLTEYYCDALPAAGMHEDHFWTNIRIILCIFCCAFGCYAQFGAKFPQDKVPIMACVAGYFLVSGIIAVMDWLFVQNSVFYFKIGEESVFLDVDLPNFSDMATISLRSKRKRVSHETSVGKYFDSEGLLCQESVWKDFVNLLGEYEKKDTGKKDSNAKKEKSRPSDASTAAAEAAS
eukprot:CAMPEP_0176104632 /NCGR_PEP_ID=MMETSP0120_2-20121206/52504_1 /TAXON_ID=160619 /ORGANISM="Kryptoperidinium foliaceum, Strain CCMP 1326" /LENGTH=201 /DNA_ID=CAMNT_0017438741 /DNA_START=51 /DNA_END=654 /DNA_ORIENTATION=-